MTEFTIDEALSLGIEAHKNGRIQEADRYYTAILDVNPNHPDANHNLGLIAVRLGKIELSLSLFRNALKADKSVEQFWLSLIDTLLKLEYYEDANTVITEAKNKGFSGETFDKLNEKIRQYLYRLEDLEKKYLPNLLELYKKKNFEAVIQKANKLVEEYPKSHVLRNILGAAHSGLQQYQEAIAAYKIAIQIKPDYAECYNNLGIAQRKMLQISEALDSFEKSILHDPNYAKAYVNLGNLKNSKSDYNEALSLYKKALIKDPNLTEALHNIGYVYLKKSEVNLAIDYLKKAIKQNPNFAFAHCTLGTAYQAKADKKRAKKSLETAIKISPNFIEALWNLQQYSVSTADVCRLLRKCLKINPQMEIAQIALATLEKISGNPSNYEELKKSKLSDHPHMRSSEWFFSLSEKPKIYFNRWDLFDFAVSNSSVTRPFYEFGVWRAESFKYLIKTFGHGYGFDTFEGLPEDWHHESKGTYSSEGNIPKIKGGEFVVGKFEDTLPKFFREERPLASVINFDADLYSSTICALTESRRVIDKATILVFDEFLMNTHWEQDEFKALKEFCHKQSLSFKVLAVSFFTKQVVVILQ